MSDSVKSLNRDELRELYRAVILEHARKPRHFGTLEHPTHSAEGSNPLCGDRLRLELDIDESGIIRDIAFDGTGCAISVASASLLTETVLGLSEAEAHGWFEDVTARLRGEQNDRELGTLAAIEGVREFPVRVKCATLAWHALQSALSHADGAATTE